MEHGAIRAGRVRADPHSQWPRQAGATPVHRKGPGLAASRPPVHGLRRAAPGRSQRAAVRPRPRLVPSPGARSSSGASVCARLFWRGTHWRPHRRRPEQPLAPRLHLERYVRRIERPAPGIEAEGPARHRKLHHRIPQLTYGRVPARLGWRPPPRAKRGPPPTVATRLPSTLRNRLPSFRSCYGYPVAAALVVELVRVPANRDESV